MVERMKGCEVDPALTFSSLFDDSPEPASVIVENKPFWGLARL